MKKSERDKEIILAAIHFIDVIREVHTWDYGASHAGIAIVSDVPYAYERLVAALNVPQEEE